ncbi:hypothetical protein HK103_003320 [Boothiomyces macroporosus]|uniref:WD40 repeat-like protein n=1 Tax=Boothiomyces macroporosus TaxID=261099 RepID=A0AAD5Y4P1_9FUNG|nr:hypothetical protein HK103_003320 [Boothiomyces macroporosus]
MDKSVLTKQSDELNAILIGHFGEDEVLASAGDNGLISIYHTNDLALKPIQLINDESTWGLAICQKFSLIAVSDNGYKITIWNLSTSNNVLGKHKRILRGHEHNIPCINFSGDGKYLISCSIDKTMRIWNVSTGEQMNTISVNPEWNWKCSFINLKDVKLISDMDKLWETIKKESENPFSNRQPSFQDALPYLERLYLLFMERDIARSIVMDRQRASQRGTEEEQQSEELQEETLEVISVTSTESLNSSCSDMVNSDASSENSENINQPMATETERSTSNSSNSSSSYHTAEDLPIEESNQMVEDLPGSNIEINIEDAMDDQNSQSDIERSEEFNGASIGQLYASSENYVLLSTIKDFYVVSPSHGTVCCIPNLFPRYHYDPDLNGMERISIVEWIPELSLAVACSQRGKVALIRLVRSEKRIGMVIIH